MDKGAQKLGKNLKRIRLKKNISQGDIARALKVNKSYISNIENGKANPTLKTILKLAKSVQSPASYLLK